MKKLVLYSNQVETFTDRMDHYLLDLIGKPNPSIGYIPSCADSDRTFYRNCQLYYARYGASMQVYFELDVCYQPELIDTLFACDAIHLSGGNTHNFLHWLKKRQMIPRMKSYVEAGGILIGVSAGSILMTPEISTADFFDEKINFGTEDISALNLVSFSFVPHIQLIPIAALQEYSRKHQVILYGCRDEDGIIVDDNKITLVGNVVKIVNGEVEI